MEVGGLPGFMDSDLATTPAWGEWIACSITPGGSCHLYPGGCQVSQAAGVTRCMSGIDVVAMGVGVTRSSPRMCFSLDFPHGLLSVWGNASCTMREISYAEYFLSGNCAQSSVDTSENFIRFAGGQSPLL